MFVLAAFSFRTTDRSQTMLDDIRFGWRKLGPAFAGYGGRGRPLSKFGLQLLYASLLFGFISTSSRAQKVTRIIDGDTFELSDGRTVRLVGIDSPELHVTQKLRNDARRTGRDARTIQELGKRSAAHARTLVLGREVELEFDPANAAINHRDRYGRTLAYIWVLDHGRRSFMINRRLVADGYASAYTSYPFRYMDEFRQLERDARGKGRGLWGSDPFDRHAMTTGAHSNEG